MKQRFREWATTIIGAIIMLVAVGLFVYSVVSDVEFKIMEMVLLAILGWVFLTARNTLLEGVFMNVFKVKKPIEKK